ncbi:MAG: MFS transporter, partial [archaeon GB-1867-035]|nr:MFS transporter [Candidatus Culexmicrobium profundum]
IFGLSPLIGLGGPIIGGWLGDKLGWKRTFIIIFSIMITSLTLLVISPIVLLSVIFYLLYGISSTMTMPISSTLVALVTPEEARGTAYSIYFIPTSVAGIIMPIIASLLVDLYGIWIIFPIAIILYLSALTLIKVIKV